MEPGSLTPTELERRALVDRCCRTTDGREYAAILASISERGWDLFSVELSNRLGMPSTELYPQRQPKQDLLRRAKRERWAAAKAAREQAQAAAMARLTGG